MKVNFQVSYGRILDAKRKFLEAARAFVSIAADSRIAEEDATHLLKKAMTCAVLAPAGPQRTRILGKLCKDGRTPALPNYQIVESMYRMKLLGAQEVASFAESLMPHQKATLSDGSTVLQAAVNEHNILACAELYDNIAFEELGSLLNIPPNSAETVAARMIGEHRLEGFIDQVEGFVSFGTDNGSSASKGMRVGRLCSSINQAVEAIITS